MITNYNGEIVNAQISKEDKNKVILSKFSFVPGFEKHFDQDIKKFSYKKVIDLSEYVHLRSIFYVTWRGEECKVEDAVFPTITISAKNPSFAIANNFEMPLWGLWINKISIQECSTYTQLLYEWKDNQPKQEKKILLTRDGFESEWKRYHDNLL